MDLELFRTLKEYRSMAAAFYRLFSRLLHHEMDAELWKLLRANLSSLPSFNAEKSALPELREAVERCAAQGEEQALLDMANLYAKEFLGMREGHCVSLCQSVYTSPRHIMYQQSVFDARDAYRSEQIELAEREDIPEDHLAVILAFLGRQAALTAELPPEADWTEALEKEARFRKKLLFNWVEALLERAQTQMPGSLYTLFLRYMGEFLRYEETEGAALLLELKSQATKSTMAAGA
ncbi:MAG: molecular chaperone TorD family protein [Deltaproteobacteria bacterium]|jgi:TorA maturation chaperone TorD|nr:molecular chaperone TorD family protein [Deltaproteobacteria bacterium]